jgi:DNA-directed RNA polymerase specialized sigma24 family protein
MPWTPEQIDQLKQLTESKTTPHIAAALGRSEGEVRWMLRKLGLKTQVPWQRDYAEARRIYKYSEEHGCRATANKYGLTVSTVKGIRRRLAKNHQKDIDAVDPERLQKLRSAAIRYACRHGYAQDAEDFASHVLIQAIHFPSTKLSWAFQTYIKDTYGDYKTEKGRERLYKERSQKHIDESPDKEDPHMGIQVGEVPSDGMAVIRALDGVKLTSQERACFVLSIQFGLRGVEIALALDVTHQRVQQILEEAIQKVGKRVIAERDSNV